MKNAVKRFKRHYHLQITMHRLLIYGQVGPRRTYLSLPVHYINSEWELCSSHLETSYFPEDHTGENIATGLKEFLQSWHLNKEKQVCITMDSGANVIKACRLNNWTRLSCFGHRLHIAIGKFPSFIPQLHKLLC